MKISLHLVFIIIFNSLSSFSQIDKENKRQARIEKRYIHPKSKYISVSSGWIFNITHTNDPNNFFDPLTITNNGLIPSIIYEHGIKNNFFGEIGYDLTSQSRSLSRDKGTGKAWSNTEASFASIKLFDGHRSHNLNIGGGYRLIGKNNYHFINFHGGFFVGFSNKSKDDINHMIGGTRTYNRSEESTGLNYEIERTYDHYSRFSIGSYLGLSKEIRLSEDVRLFFKYTHRFGFNPTFKGTYVMNSDDIDFKYDASFIIRGGASLVTGGLKILLFKSKLE